MTSGPDPTPPGSDSRPPVAAPPPAPTDPPAPVPLPPEPDREARFDSVSDLVLVPARELARIRWFVRVLVAVVVVLGVAMGVTFPRSRAYSGLLEENRTLRERVQTIDRQMTEVDRLLLRLRLYDAQIKSLAEPDGDHGGPLRADVFANGHLQADLDLEAPSGSTGTPMEPFLEASALRPAEAWAMSVEARVTTFLALVDSAEVDVSQVLSELEDLRALEEALPSQWPAAGPLTSGFGWRRAPIGRRTWRFHSGLDIAGDRGDPIRAPARGRVTKAEYNAGYGKMIEIDHGFGITTIYGHCNTLRVRVGDSVERGDLIGNVGSTGHSTGPHVHFEVRLDGNPVDPMDYLPR